MFFINVEVSNGHQRTQIYRYPDGVCHYEDAARPKSPPELTPSQAREWREIIDRLHADWFRLGSRPLLVQYVRHCDRARHLAQLIKAAEATEPIDHCYHHGLLAAEEKQSRAIAALVGKMRLTQAIRLMAETAAVVAAKPGANVRAIWDRLDSFPFFPKKWLCEVGGLFRRQQQARGALNECGGQTRLNPEAHR